MSNPRMIIGGFVAGVLAFTGLFAFVFLGLGPTAAAPPTAPAAQAAVTATPLPAAPAGAPGKQQSGYGELLAQNFAARLGVDRAKLDAAFSAAVQDTVDQAVRDGKLTQDQAGKVRTQAGSGLAALFEMGVRASDEQAGLGAEDVNAILAAVAQLFGLNADQLRGAGQGGQTLDALEQSHHVTAQQVRDAALHAIRARLDQGVQSGKWTQPGADKMYQAYSDEIDNVLLKMIGAPPKAEDTAPAGAFGPAVEGAVANLLHLSGDEFAAALKSGQTLAALEQSRNLDHAQVRAAALAAAQSVINQGLQSGQWTQAQVDAQVGNVGDMVDRMLTKMGGPAAGGSGATP